MTKTTGLRFFWRVIILLGLVIALGTIAILIRDSGFAVLSTAWLATTLRGSNPPWSIVDAISNLVLLSLIVVAVVWVIWPRCRYWRLTRKQRENVTATSSTIALPSSPTSISATLLPDAPLRDPAHDELERFGFARDIVHTITVAPPASSFVVSIEGPWGEGKTTILRWVLDELKAHTSRPVLVSFDPWPEDTKRGVVARLLDSIAIAINSRQDLPESSKIEAARLFGRLADAAASDMPSSYGFIRGLVGWLMYPDKANYRPHRFSGLDIDRENLQQCVAKLAHRLVVLVDDLDRVDGEELRTILMAVNALSSFENMIVVLAFDPQVVDATLAGQGFASADSGSNFREKIVQVSRPLPRPTFSDSQRLLEHSLQDVLVKLNALTYWNFCAPELAQQAIMKATELAKSPRSIKRLANHTGLLVARLQTEVNGSDVLLLELLRAQYPAAWYYIRANSELFNPRNFDLSVDRSKDAPTPITRAIEEVPPAAKTACGNVLAILFPRYADRSVTRSSDPDEEVQSRVSVGKNLSKYFHLGVESDDVSDTDARTFVNQHSARAGLAAKMASRGALGALLVAASAQIKAGAVPEAAKLCEIVMSEAARAWREKSHDFTEEATLLIYRAIESLSSEDERFAILKAIATDTTSISISQSLVLDLLQHAQLWSSGVRKPSSVVDTYFDRQLVHNPQLEELRRLWLQTAWRVGVPAMFENEPIPVSNLFRMAQLDESPEQGYQRVQAAMGEYLQPVAHLVTFVSQFSASVRGITYGLDGVHRLVPEWQNFLRRVVELKEPRDAIEKFRESLEALEIQDQQRDDEAKTKQDADS